MGQEPFFAFVFSSPLTQTLRVNWSLSRQAHSRDIRDLRSKVQTFAEEKDTMMGEHTDLQKQKAKLELDLGDLSSELDGESSQKVS